MYSTVKSTTTTKKVSNYFTEQLVNINQLYCILQNFPTLWMGENAEQFIYFLFIFYLTR